MEIDPLTVQAARESRLSAPPADYPGYREKFWVSGYDGDAGIGFSIWLETTPGDYSRWTESLHVALPDGRLLTSVTDTPGQAGADVGGQHAFAHCREPLQVWDYSVRTRAKSSRFDGWPAEPLGEARLELDLRLTSASAAFEVSKAPNVRNEDVTFGSQYRQFFKAAGTIEADGRRYAFNAPGFRARTTGSFSGAKYGGHAMVSVLFPSGRGAMYLRQIQPDLSPIVEWAVVLEGGRAYTARIVDAPFHLPTVTAANERYGVTLESEIGCLAIGVRTLAPILSVRANYFVDVARTPDDLDNVSRQAEGLANNIAFAQFESEGEVGFGTTERSARLSLLDMVK